MKGRGTVAASWVAFSIELEWDVPLPVQDGTQKGNLLVLCGGRMEGEAS